MKKRKTKLWKKVLVGFMSVTMFLGNLSSLSIEAFAATEDVLDYEEGADQFAEEIDEEVIPEEPITEDAIDEGIENPDDQFGEFGYEYAESEEEEYEEITYYTVTYYDVDGSLLGSTEFAEGSALSMPQTGEGAYWTDEAGTEYFEGDAVYDNLSLFVNVDDIDLEEEIEEVEELAEGQILVNAVLADDEGNVLDSFRITSDMYLNPDDDNDAPEIEGYEFVSAMIDQSTVSEILVTETEEGLLEYTVDGVVLEADADIVLNYESTEFKYNISIQIVDEDGRVIEGYEDAELPEIDGTLDLADVQNAPVEVEGYDYVGASIGEENVYSVTVEAGDGYYETDNGFTDIESDITIKLNYAEASVAVVLKATIVDEFGDEIDEKYTEMEMPEFDADGILTLDDPELPPVEDVKVKTGIIRSVKYTYVRTTINGKIVSAIKAEDAVGGLGTYYSYTTDGETWIKIKEDTTVLFEYTDGKKTTYTYSDGMVSVTATLQHANAVPDDAYFAVTPLTAGSGYNVDAFIDALNAQAEMPDGADDFEYNTTNTLLYDVAFYTDESMTEEIEPADGMVRTEIVFLQNQLKDELSAGEESDLIINHLSIDDSLLEAAGTTANADVSSGAISVESVQADVSVAGETLAFMTDSYSVITITQPNMVLKYTTGGVDISAVLGDAYNFGIVADSYNQSGDSQTNMAVNTFTDGADIGSDLSNNAGTMYVGTITNLLKIKSGSVVYYGEKNESNKIIFQGGSADAIALPMKESEISSYISEMVSYVSANVPEAGENMNVVPGQNEKNQYTLDISSLPDDAVVHIDLDNVSSGEYGIYDVIDQNGGLNLKKSAGQTVIFHSSRSSVHLKGFNVWNGSSYVKTTASNGSAFLDSMTSGIIFDLRGATSVDLEDALSGVFIAPNAAVNVHGGACSGWLIAGSVTGSTEWHFVSQHVPQPDVENDTCTLDLKLTKTLLDDDIKAPADPSLWPEEGFTFKISKYPCNDDGDSNDGGIIHDFDSIPDLTGMEGGVKYVTVTKDQAGQAVTLGTADFKATDIWNSTNLWYGDHKYIGFMYKIEEQPCETPGYTIDTKPYYVKFFVNVKEIRTGSGTKYYVWVDGPHVANTVTKGTHCQPIEIEIENKYSRPELTQIEVTKAWSDYATNAHTNDEVVVQLTRKENGSYIDVEGETLTLPYNNSWTGTFEDLPKKDSDGNVIEYSVREVSVNGAEVTNENGQDTVSVGNRVYFASLTGDAANGFTITNTISGYGKFVIGKAFSGTSDGSAYDRIQFNVYRAGDDPNTTEPVVIMTRQYENKRTIFKAERLDFGDYYIVESGTGIEGVDFTEFVTSLVMSDGTIVPLGGRICAGADIAARYAGQKVGVTDVFTFSEDLLPVYGGPRVATGYVDIENKYADKANLRIHKMIVNNWSSDNVHSILNNVEFKISNDNGYIILHGFDSPIKGKVGTATGYGAFAGQTFDVEYNGNAQWTIFDLPKGSYLVEEVADGLTFAYDAATDTSTVLPSEWSRVTHYGVSTDAESSDSRYSVTGIENERRQTAESNDQNVNPVTALVGDESVGNGSHTQTVQVSNFYSKPSATLNVTKSYEGWTDGDSDRTFTFTITSMGNNATDYAGNPIVNPMPASNTVTVSADTPEASFGRIDYKYEGSYYYQISEDIPGGSTRVTRDGQIYYLGSDGILYDSKNVYVKVDIGQFDSTFQKIYTNTGEYTETFTFLGSTATYYSDPSYSPDSVIDTASSAGAEGSAINATFTNKQEELISVSGSKEWNDANDQDGVRPGSIKITLLANGEDAGVEPKTVTADDNWAWTFDNLPKCDSNGAVISYSVKEDAVRGYDTAYSGMNVINTHITEKTEISVTKKWVGDEGNESLRGDGAVIHLIAKVGDTEISLPNNITTTCTLTGNETYTFSNLPVYSGGQKITYSVTEDELQYYTTAGPTGDAENGFTFTNTFIDEKISIPVSKLWDDKLDIGKNRPEYITLYLDANGQPYTSVVLKPGDEGVTVSTSGEIVTWSYTFEDLPKYMNGAEVQYTIRESEVNGYTPSEPTVVAPVDGHYDYSDGLSITNSYTPGETGVTVTKVWVDGDGARGQDGIRPLEITVKLLADGEQAKDSEGNDLAAVLNAGNNWTYSWTGLVKTKGMQDITYTVEEITVEGYETGYVGNGTSTVTITNTHVPETTGLEGTKTWLDDNDREAMRPSMDDYRSYIKLYADDVLTDKVPVITKINDSQWKWEFTDLPKYSEGNEIAYRVEETPVEGYSSSGSGNNFINTHIFEKTSVPVEKIWDDDSDRDRIRPANITLRLWNGETLITTHTLSGEGNKWSYTFENLPKYENIEGVKTLINYTVTEDEVTGYITSESTVDGVKTFTNKYTPSRININGTKTWDDNDDQDGKRPPNITIRLYANGSEIKTAVVDGTVTDANGRWTYSFSNLPEKEDGVVINYTISEDPVAEYDTVISKFDITNKHIPEKVEIPVTKVWDDADNHDGKRPTSVTLHLLADGNPAKDANGNEISAVVLSADSTGKWAWTFTNLPKYADGHEIRYTVTEDEVSMYNSEISVVSEEPPYDYSKGITVTNTHEVVKLNIHGVKTWDDDNNRDGRRPGSITVSLLANGAPAVHADGSVVDSVPVSATDNWEWLFTDLPKYSSDGSQIVYTISETLDDQSADYYQVSYDQPVIPADSDDSALITVECNITNKYNPEYVNISVSKVWEDNGNQDNLRPDRIQVQLFADGQLQESKSIYPVDPTNASGAWGTATFENLPKYRDNGVLINYSVKEISVSDAYTTNISNSVADGVEKPYEFVVTNSHSPETITLEGSKIWDDDDNRDALRPSQVKITISGDSELEGTQRVVYASAPKWEWTCENLPKLDQGNEISYTVTEEVIPGYDLTSVSKPGPYTGDTSEINLTNTHIPAVVTVEGDKIWDDDSNRDHVRPAQITVKLLADNVPVDSQEIEGDETAGSWHWAFPATEGRTYPRYRYDSLTNTAIPIVYTVEEVIEFENSDKYKVYPATAGTDDGSGHISGIEIRNEHEIEIVNISGKKTWKDDFNNDGIEDRDGIRPQSIKITLYANGSVAHIDGVTNPATATAAGNWVWAFENLPKNDADGNEIHYTVKEEAVSGYTGGGKDDPTDPVNFGNAETTGNVTNITDVEFKNTHVPENVGFSGTKVWDDDNNRDGYRPDSITLHLFQNDKEISWPVTFTDNGDNTWTWSYTGLPKYTDHGHSVNVYKVEEEQVEHYDEPAYSGTGNTTITNTHTPEPTSIKAVKVWDDNNNQDGKRNAETRIVFHLLADGVEIDSAEVGEADGWMHEFTGLNKYNENHTEIIYTVTEDKYTDYSQSGVDVTEEAGVKVFTFTNKYTPRTTSVSVTKIWNDADNQDGIRPDSITVKLLANGEQAVDSDGNVLTAVLNDSNNWTYTFLNLDEYKNGALIAYSVEEDTTGIAVDPEGKTGYNLGEPTASEDGYTWTITNTHIPELTDITITKKWEDVSNQDGKRPSFVTVHLFADGEEINSVNLNGDTKDDLGRWTYTFTNLPKYADGEEIKYTITEDTVAEYDTEIKGFNIINTHVPETISVSVQKFWEDNDNQDNVRPRKITFILKADGVQMDSVELDVPATASGRVSHTFADLPKYKDGGHEIVYTVAEGSIEGYEPLIEGTSADGFKITNTHDPKTVEINGHKEWRDANDQDGIRRDIAWIEIQLLADGAPALRNGEELSVKAYPADNWAWKFENMPMYENGRAIQYSVREIGAFKADGTPVDGYTAEVNSSNIYDHVVYNTHEPAYVGLTVTKKWVGDFTGDVQSVQIRIEGRRSDGTVVVPEGNATINRTLKASDWTVSISPEDKILPKYYNGEPIQYFVIETVPEDASYIQLDASGAKVANGYAVQAVADETGDELQAALTNMALTRITVQKQWEDDPGYYGGQDYVSISLLADGVEYKTVQVKASDDWKYTFENLPIFNENGSKITYTVAENTKLPDYNAANGGQPVIDYSQLDETGTIIIKNVLDPLSLTVNKQWLGDPAGTKHNDITVRIYSSIDLKGTTASVMDRIKKVIGIDSGSWYLYDTITLGESDNWTTTINDLPRYAKVGNDIVKVSYAVEEADVPEGYTSVTNVDGSIATIINTGYTSVAGFKTWDDGSNVVGYRPGSAEFASMIVLFQDGKQYMTGSDTEHFRWIDTAGDSWSFEFYDLPAGHTYTIGEIARVLGYGEPTIDGYTIRNPLEFTQIGVTKIWDDEDNAYATRPASIAFRLLANGAQANIAGVTPIVTLDNTNGASYVWRNLPVNDRNGNKIAYNVEEVAVPAGYSESVSRNGDMFVITNTFRPVDTQITVHKVWDDQDDAAGVRPASIEVALTRNGADIETVTLNASNGWSYTWSGLPTILADGSGTRAEYGVREVSQILGYSVSITGEGEVYTITNYYREPSTPPTPPNTPPETPETPNGTRTPTQPPYTIPDEPTPLAGLSEVLGARRSPNNSVLGARRSPATGDASNAAAFAAAMASAGAMMGAWFAMRKRNKKG